MDQRKQFSLDQYPASLLTGFGAKKIAYEFFRNLFCTNCSDHCDTCQSIDNHQHPNIIWIVPEKMYTLSDIESLFSIAAFTLAKTEQTFFVLEKSDYLTAAVANRLLKLIEEPPAGYHFIFLAHRPAHILPTIRSRCILMSCSAIIDNVLPHNIAQPFFSLNLPDASQFLQLLDNNDINESETFELIDQLFIHWQNQSDDNTYKKKIIMILSDALEKPPMPGSSKLFWKNLYLQLVNK